MIAALYPSLPTIGVRGVLLGKGPFSSLLYTVANFVENRPIHENLSTKIVQKMSKKSLPKNVLFMNVQKNVPAYVQKNKPKISRKCQKMYQKMYQKVLQKVPQKVSQKCPEKYPKNCSKNSLE